MAPLLSLAHITKQFGPVRALHDVSFAVAPGEVHALLGENGAGKSTLMHVAYGMAVPDAGTIAAGDGVPRPRLASPREARALGLGMVHQHFTSIPALTVAENVVLAAGWRDTGRRAERRTADVVARLGLPLDPAARVETLSVQLRQRLEIVQALASEARVLLLDEPSAVLAPREVRELLETVRRFAATGGAVVLITHKLDEVFAAADRVTVLRRGEVAFAGPLAGQSRDSLARAMLGADLPRTPRAAPVPGEVLVSLRDATFGRGAPLSLEVRAGEILGVAAIEGNGQRELLRGIAQVDDVRVVRGAMAVAAPVAFVPEDRIGEALIPAFTLTENVTLGLTDRLARWIDWRAQRARTAELLDAFDVRAEGPDATAGALSGGNQQKLVFARALETAPRVIVAEDPTRGLDILATQAIHERLRDAAAGGAAVIVHSSDLDEVLDLATRVVALVDGTLIPLPADASREAVGDAMLGVARA